MHVARTATTVTPFLRSLSVTARYSYHAGPSSLAFACALHHIRRALSTKPLSAGSLKNDEPDQAFVGSEGLHYSDSSTKLAKEKSEVTGDWVLFHPVYKDNEMKAVSVCN